MGWRAKVEAKYQVEGTSVSHLIELAKRDLRRFFGDMHLPLPEFQLVSDTNPKWLGRTFYQSDKPQTTLIKIQKSIMEDEKTLDRVLLHELIHHADLIKNPPTNSMKDRLSERIYQGHGPFFKEQMKRINGIMGKDYITTESNVTFVEDAKNVEFFVLIQPAPNGRYGWSYALRPSHQQKEVIKQRIKENNARLVKTRDGKFLDGTTIKPFGGYSVPRDKEFADYLAKLYHDAKHITI